jgi:hypothetical protein
MIPHGTKSSASAMRAAGLFSPIFNKKPILRYQELCKGLLQSKENSRTLSKL